MPKRTCLIERKGGVGEFLTVGEPKKSRKSARRVFVLEEKVGFKRECKGESEVESSGRMKMMMSKEKWN